MDRKEVSNWFDKAFKYIYEGNFASAASCFQQVIDRSTDVSARAIARRDLEWYCFSLESMVKKLKDASGPMALEELLSEVLDSTTSSKYVQLASGYLEKVATVYRLDNRLWIYQPYFEVAIKLVVDDFQTRNLPATLTELAQELLMLLNAETACVNEHILHTLKVELSKTEGIFLLDNNCVFERRSLEHFRSKLIRLIRQTKRPINLVGHLTRLSAFLQVWYTVL